MKLTSNIVFIYKTVYAFKGCLHTGETVRLLSEKISYVFQKLKNPTTFLTIIIAPISIIGINYDITQHSEFRISTWLRD